MRREDLYGPSIINAPPTKQGDRDRIWGWRNQKVPRTFSWISKQLGITRTRAFQQFKKEEKRRDLMAAEMARRGGINRRIEQPAVKNPPQESTDEKAARGSQFPTTRIKS